MSWIWNQKSCILTSVLLLVLDSKADSSTSLSLTCVMGMIQTLYIKRVL